MSEYRPIMLKNRSCPDSACDRSVIHPRIAQKKDFVRSEDRVANLRENMLLELYILERKPIICGIKSTKLRKYEVINQMPIKTTSTDVQLLKKLKSFLDGDRGVVTDMPAFTQSLLGSREAVSPLGFSSL